MTDVPAGPVAYCAPGQKVAAADLLEANGQTVTKIKEHPWLTGPEVFIVHPEVFAQLRIREMPCWEPPEFWAPAWWQETLLRRIGGFAQAASDTRTEPGQPNGLNEPVSVGEHPANGPL